MAIPTRTLPQGLGCQGTQLLPTNLLEAAARRRRLRNQRVVQSSRIQSQQDAGEDQQEEDSGLSIEFEQMKNKALDPQRKTELAQHLNLLWSVSERKGPEVCDCCRGTGEIECPWCHGTGAMTVGETLYCSETGCEPCPVCRGSGGCKCQNCRGIGKRAPWMKGSQGGCPTPS